MMYIFKDSAEGKAEGIFVLQKKVEDLLYGRYHAPNKNEDLFFLFILPIFDNSGG